MNEVVTEVLRYFAGNYKKIFVRLLLIYVLLYPIVAVYSILGVWGHKRFLNKKDLGAGPLVKERASRNEYFGEDSFNWRNALGSFGILEPPIRFETAVIEVEESEKLVVNELEIEDALSAAHDIVDDLIIDLDDRPFLYVTIINDAFEEMMMNWLCNVESFGTILDRTLIIAGSKGVCERIQKEYSEVACVFVTLSDTFNGDFEESPEHRREFTVYRLKIMEKLAASGLNYLNFDTNALWLRYLSDLFRNAAENEELDIITGASGYEDETPYSSDPLLVLANNRSISFLAEAGKLMESSSEMELKDVINKLCLERFYNSTCDRFKWSDVADGLWLEYGPRQRARHSPYIVSNNLLREIVDKTARQQINKMWLLKKGKCDAGLRKKFFMEYGDKEIAAKLKYTKEKEYQGLWSRSVDFIQELWSDFRWNLGKVLKFVNVL